MWIGIKRNCKETPLDMKWPSKPIKSLGVYFTYDQTKSVNLNFEVKIKKTEKMMQWWKARGVSILG